LDVQVSYNFFKIKLAVTANATATKTVDHWPFQRRSTDTAHHIKNIESVSQPEKCLATYK